MSQVQTVTTISTTDTLLLNGGNEKSNPNATQDQVTPTPSSSSPRKRDALKGTFKRKRKDEPFAQSQFDARFLDLPEPEQTRFWTCPLLVVQYAIAFVALVSRQLWILQGILLVTLAFISYIIYQWIYYILNDPQLHKCAVSFRWYLGFACRQAERTIEGGNARRMVEAGVLAWRGTATSFLKWFYRQRSANINRVMIQQHEQYIERLKRFQTSLKKSF